MESNQSHIDSSCFVGGDLLGKISRTTQEILSTYPPHPRFLLPILQDIQAARKYLPVSEMKAVAEYLDVPDSRVYAVATFYKSLSLVPKGDVEIKLCMGTACHLRGAGAVLAKLERALGVENGSTTPDGRFSLETVNCLGACALAPVVVAGEKTFGKADAATVKRIIEEPRDP